MKEKRELPAINFTNRPKRISSRLTKTNPRALGTNPRALGTNPKAKRKSIDVR
jgi:hypothetical protein